MSNTLIETYDPDLPDPDCDPDLMEHVRELRLAEAGHVASGVKVYPAFAFVEMDQPPRGLLIDPILPRGGLGMLYAPRGVGKTWAALALAWAAATGTRFLRWTCPEPVKVLLVDGEMTGPMLAERLHAIMLGSGETMPSERHLRVCPADLCEEGFPNICTPEGAGALDAIVEDSDLIILDNLASLARGCENDQDRWLPMQDWSLKMRRQGRSVLWVHHAGKSGQQRGTSRREDVLDLVMALRRPEGARAGDGARFEVHIEKCRGASGPLLESFEAKLEMHGKGALWSYEADPERERERRTEEKRIADPLAALKAEAEKLLIDGWTVRGAALHTGLSHSRVGRLREELIGEGRVAPKRAPKSP